jgi:hypothetical protein
VCDRHAERKRRGGGLRSQRSTAEGGGGKRESGPGTCGAESPRKLDVEVGLLEYLRIDMR